MGMFRRDNDQDRWDRTPRRFRQPEFEGPYNDDARRALPGERGLGWARRRDIDDRISQQAAPRGGGRYDRSGEERYAEGLDDFEERASYGPSRGWDLDEGGVQFGRARFGEQGYRYRQGDFGRTDYGDHGRGGVSRGSFGRDDYGRGDWSGERGGQFRGMGPRGYQRSDERVRDDVCDLLTDDDYVDASDIDIQVSSGVVALTGTVSSRGTKRRVEDLVESVSGVREVQNNLRVQSANAPTGEQQRAGIFAASREQGSSSGAAATETPSTDKSRR